MLHHVCNDHDWPGGICDHGELKEHELPWFSERDGDYKALQTLILDPQFMLSLKFYSKFRHTGILESANNHSLSYAGKRFAFTYKGFQCRKMLAAIDWNYHISRPASSNEEGEEIVTRKYNPRTRSWTSQVIKVKKDFSYIPMMMAKIFKRRLTHRTRLNDKVDISQNDPRNIAPNIAAVQPKPSKEIHKLRVQARSRFASQNR